MTLHIALIRQEQTGGDGGAQAIIDLMLQALEQENDVKISLLCRKWESSLTAQSNKGIDHKTQKVIINPPFSNRKNKQTSFNEAVHDYLREHDFDLIQSHERFAGCHIFRAGDGVHKVWLEQKAKVSNPIQRWWAKHSPYHKNLLLEEKQMFESQSLKRVICNSQMVKQEILRNFSIAPEQVQVIYNGVDTKHYKPANPDIKATIRAALKIPKNDRVFIFSGSGFERKNLRTTLEAFATLGEQCHLLVVGRDKKASAYKKLANTLGCEQRVHFLGAQPRDKMPGLYQAADVLVLPTLYDPFANVILEGLASGLPCITSTKCGAVDIIPDYQCGKIIEATDTPALTLAMQSYMDDKTLESDAARAVAASKQFTKEHMQKQLIALYHELLEKHHA